MKCFFSPDYVVDMGGHTFPTRKFALAAEMLVAAGTLSKEDLVDPGLPDPRDLLCAHTSEWVEKASGGRLTLDDEMIMELRWTEALALAHRKAVKGTLLACREALATGLGLHSGGGSHHAFADHGEGFCVFNDLAAALLRLKEDRLLTRAAVVDLDVHQGNGTAAILAGRTDLLTFSMHQDDLYPAVKPRSTLDIALPAGTSDAKYLKLLSVGLAEILGRAPELVLYQAGVDCWEGDSLGGLRLTASGLASRDRMVFEACFSRGIPVAITLGGGYAERVETVAGLHARTLTEGVECHRRLWSGGSPISRD